MAVVSGNTGGVTTGSNAITSEKNNLESPLPLLAQLPSTPASGQGTTYRNRYSTIDVRQRILEGERNFSRVYLRGLGGFRGCDLSGIDSRDRANFERYPIVSDYAAAVRASRSAPANNFFRRQPNLGTFNFSGANLRDASFSEAILVGADFSGADLQDAHFTNAFVDGMNVEGADLRGVSGLDLSRTHGKPARRPEEPSDQQLAFSAELQAWRAENNQQGDIRLVVRQSDELDRTFRDAIVRALLRENGFARMPRLLIRSTLSSEVAQNSDIATIYNALVERIRQISTSHLVADLRQEMDDPETFLQEFLFPLDRLSEDLESRLANVLECLRLIDEFSRQYAAIRNASLTDPNQAADTGASTNQGASTNGEAAAANHPAASATPAQSGGQPNASAGNGRQNNRLPAGILLPSVQGQSGEMEGDPLVPSRQQNRPASGTAIDPRSPVDDSKQRTTIAPRTPTLNRDPQAGRRPDKKLDPSVLVVPANGGDPGGGKGGSGGGDTTKTNVVVTTGSKAPVTKPQSVVIGKIDNRVWNGNPDTNLNLSALDFTPRAAAPAVVPRVAPASPVVFERPASTADRSIQPDVASATPRPETGTFPFTLPTFNVQAFGDNLGNVFDGFARAGQGALSNLTPSILAGAGGATANFAETPNLFQVAGGAVLSVSKDAAAGVGGYLQERAQDPLGTFTSVVTFIPAKAAEGIGNTYNFLRMLGGNGNQ